MVEYQVGDTVFEILNNSSDKFSRAQEQTNQDSRVRRILPLKIHYLREDDMSRQKGPEAGYFRPFFTKLLPTKKIWTCFNYFLEDRHSF